MADEEPGVDRDLPVEAVEELAEAVPLPGRSLLERVDRHPLDPRHHALGVEGVLVLERRQREPAVAGDHGGDAVQTRRRRPTVPVQLRVVVRVRVDEPGRDEEPGSVEHRPRVVGDVADLHDAAVADPDVGHVRLAAGAVDDGPALDHMVEHVASCGRGDRVSRARRARRSCRGRSCGPLPRGRARRCPR